MNDSPDELELAAAYAVEDTPPAIQHQPHLGYALGITTLAFLLLQIATLFLVVIGESRHLLPAQAATHLRDFPKVVALAMAVSYGGSFLFVWWLFPRLWHRSFGAVLEWNASAALSSLPKLMGIGIALSIAAQMAQHFLPVPKDMPMDDYFRTSSDAWVMMLFGTFVAPAFEELLFRGFLLRGLAIAWDWMRTPKTPEGKLEWHTTDTLSTPAILFASVLTSIGFAVMHAAQLGYTWSVVGVLWCVGLVLTWVRLRFRSLAASTLVHASYNGFLFVLMFVYTSGFRYLERMQR